MNATIFVDFPSDILLEICSHLTLEEVLCFLSICSTFRRLSNSRFLWISTLEKTQAVRPIACPVGEDLSRLELQTLRYIAHHTRRLEKNWTRYPPSILGAVKSKQYTINQDKPHVICSVIEGTNLVILYSPQEGLLTCCDLGAVTPPASIYVGKISWQSYYDEFQKHILALVTQNSATEISLLVIYVEYGDEGDATMRRMFHTDLDAMPLATCVYKDVVVVVSGEDTIELSATAINFVTNSSIAISADLGSLIISACCRVLGNTFYAIVEVRDMYSVYCCSIDMFPAGESVGCNNGKLTLDTQMDFNWVFDGDLFSADVVKSHVALSPNGFQMLYTRVGYSYSDSVTTTAMFWPIATAQAPYVCDDVSYAGLRLRGDVRASPTPPWSPLVASAPSGTYSIFVIDREGAAVCESDSYTDICILHFTRHPPAVNLCNLTLPFFIDLNEVYSLAVDERRGVIYLSHIRGYLFSVPFA